MRQSAERGKSIAPTAAVFWRFMLALSVLLCSVLFGACHGAKQREGFQVPEEFDTQTPVEITFWAKNDTNKSQADIYRQAITDFQELYPNVTVNLRLYTDYNKIYNDVITNMSTDTTPNVCITYPDHIATYMTGDDVVVPLDEIMTDPHYGLGGDRLRYQGPNMGDMIPEFLEECRIGEETYALPYMRSTEACYINKTYVEQLGYELPEILTWDFIWEVSEAAMATDEAGNYRINGQKVMIPFIYKSTDNMMIQYLEQRDAPYSDEHGHIDLFNDATTEFLTQIAEHAANGAFSTFKISSYPGNFLNAGQCIFAVDSTAGSTWMGSEAPLMDIAEEDVVPFETAVRMVPQTDPLHPKMISQGPSVCIFNKEDPQVVLASWLFAQYLLTDTVQSAYAQTEGYVPVTLSARNSAVYQDYLYGSYDDEQHYEVKLAATKLLLSHTRCTFVTPVFNGSASLRAAAGQLIENVTKSVRRKETVDGAYFVRLYNDVSALYRLEDIEAAEVGTGELPEASLMLIVSICGVWVILISRKILLTDFLDWLSRRLPRKKKAGTQRLEADQ